MTEIYTSIHTLPFRLFRQIILHGDLKLLIIAGEVQDLELSAIWENLLEEYADALGETNADGYLSTRRELIYYQTQRFLVDTYIKLLSEFYVDKWAKALNKITRSDFKFNPYNKDEYYRLLERSLNRSKTGIDVQISIALEKLKEIEKKHSGKALKPNEEYFEKVLLNLHEFSNWQFDNNDITTFQYCELVRRYQQHLEYLKNKK